MQQQRNIAIGRVDRPSSHLQPRLGMIHSANRTSNTVPVDQYAWCTQTHQPGGNQIKDSTLEYSKKTKNKTKAPQYPNQHDAGASCLYWEEFWVQCHSEKKKKRPNVCWKCVGLFSAGFISLNAEEAVNLRLRSSSDAKAYEAPQEQQPAKHRSKGTQQAEVQQPAHRNHQTLFPKWVKHQIMHWKH